MISIGKLLVKNSGCASAHLKLLLNGIAATAPEIPGCATQLLRQGIDEVIAEVDCSGDSDTVSSHLTHALHLVDGHNRSVEAAAAAQQKELRCMISATTDTIAAIGNSSKDGIDHLRKLESSLESAATAEDLRLLRNRLFACLTLVRNESIRVQLESQKLTRSLKTAVLKASSELDPGTDSITGLPGPDRVNKSVRDLLAQGEAFCATIFVLADLKSWNARLGRHAGDEILQAASDFLRSQLEAEGATYRWNGPAFLVTCSGDETTLAEFEGKARQIGREGFQCTVVLEGKLKVVSMPFTWIAQRFPATANPEQVLRALEECADSLQNRH